MTTVAQSRRHLAIRNGLLGFCGSLVLFYALVIILEPVVFEDRFGLDATVAGQDVSLLLRQQAVDKVGSSTAEYLKGEILVGGKSQAVSGLAKSFDIEGTVEAAIKDQNNNFFSLKPLFKHEYALTVVPDEVSLSKYLLTASKEKSAKPQDARIVFDKNGNADIEKELSGKKLYLPETRDNIIEALGGLKNTAELKVVDQNPAIKSTSLIELNENVKKAVSSPVIFKHGAMNFEIKTTDLKSWLKVSNKNPDSVVVLPDLLGYRKTSTEFSYFDQLKVATYVDDVAKKINQSPQNALLAYKDNALTVTRPDAIGRSLDKINLVSQIQTNIISEAVIVPRVAETEAAVRRNNLSELGIVGLVSTGWSDFKGSPVNRTHNVKTGASKFNSVLIRPDEGFSFNDTLGPVDASTGYLPELVILLNKTVPEYGGGMCQVSSTAFRAALNAGLPILERTNHSYPVQYYTPFGVDASIYLPQPDLVFKNDTGKYILIQTRIEGTKLYFDFFGTKKVNTVKFSGNDKADGAVEIVEKVSPLIYDKEARGKGSFTAVFWRHNYDAAGKLLKSDKFVSKYNSPDQYPH